MDTTSDGRNDNAAASIRPSYEELAAENRRLQARVQELLLLIEKLRRETKRQAAPFRKQDGPAAEPKKPGRKSGRRHGPHAHRAAPPRIDETYDVPLPEQCQHCGSPDVQETHVAPQYQTEIPRTVIYRQFEVHVGVCEPCGQTVEGRHALQINAARGAAASPLGANVHAALAIMNKQLGLSHGKSVKLLGTLFEELTIARGTSARSIARTAERCEPAYEQLRHDVRGSPQVVPDETGWRVGGRTAWLHAFLGQRETCYVIDPTGSGEPAKHLLGLGWSGTLVHDGWSVYDQFTQAAHQQCLAHLQRRCEELLETARAGAACLPHAVLELIDRAYALRRAWRGHRLSGDALADCGLGLATESAFGRASAESCHGLVLVPDRSHDRRHELSWRTSHSPRGGESPSVGRQPHLAWCTGAEHPDVCDPHVRTTSPAELRLPDPCPLQPQALATACARR